MPRYRRIGHTGTECAGAAGASAAGRVRITINRARRIRNETILFMVRTILSVVFDGSTIPFFAISIQQHFAVILIEKHYILCERRIRTVTPVTILPRAARGSAVFLPADFADHGLQGLRRPGVKFPEGATGYRKASRSVRGVSFPGLLFF
jgi:hypothetical protein